MVVVGSCLRRNDEVGGVGVVRWERWDDERRAGAAAGWAMWGGVRRG